MPPFSGKAAELLSDPAPGPQNRHGRCRDALPTCNQAHGLLPEFERATRSRDLRCLRCLRHFRSFSLLGLNHTARDRFFEDKVTRPDGWRPGLAPAGEWLSWSVNLAARKSPKKRTVPGCMPGLRPALDSTIDKRPVSKLATLKQRNRKAPFVDGSARRHRGGIDRVDDERRRTAAEIGWVDMEPQ